MPTDQTPTSTGEILFTSNTDEPTEFTWNGETIVNFGEVTLIALPPVELAP